MLYYKYLIYLVTIYLSIPMSECGSCPYPEKQWCWPNVAIAKRMCSSLGYFISLDCHCCQLDNAEINAILEKRAMKELKAFMKKNSNK